jgi:hypothetical protein
MAPARAWTAFKAGRQRQIPVVIVIGALDECEDENYVQTIIPLLAEAWSLKKVRLRVLITSRREVPIRYGFCQILHGKTPRLHPPWHRGGYRGPWHCCTCIFIISPIAIFCTVTVVILLSPVHPILTVSFMFFAFHWDHCRFIISKAPSPT